MMKRVHPEGHEVTHSLLNDRGLLLSGRGRSDEAMALYERALAIQEAARR